MHCICMVSLLLFTQLYLPFSFLLLLLLPPPPHSDYLRLRHINALSRLMMSRRLMCFGFSSLSGNDSLEEANVASNVIWQLYLLEKLGMLMGFLL